MRSTPGSGSTPRPPAASSPTTPGPGDYTLPPEHAVALTDETVPAFLPGFFQIAFGTVRDADRIFELARDGDGLGWGDHNSDVHVGCERFFRPGYAANLVAAWLPALTGVVAKLEAGARVADIGCGHGASTILMAQAFPQSTFVGSDAHAARSRPPGAGRGGRGGRPDHLRVAEPAAGFAGAASTW